MRALFRVLSAGVALTAIHYTDNYLYFDEYPQPGSLRRWQVYAAWLVLTAIGAAGYALYARGFSAPAYVCLIVYSYTGLSSLGHYLYGSLDDFSAKQHVFILVDGLTGAAVLAFVAWSVVTRRRRGSTSAVGGNA
ncbi:MAG: hypothetical protein M3134_02985 [Actinomycetota bacterium]|nr:hypothetical protein [Actinomycetota bacterium]